MSEFDPDMVEFELDASERMSEQEALMWNVEKDPWLNPSGGALTITDRPPDADLLRRIMRHAVSGIPRMYQRVVPGLARISTPAWIPDPEFDFDHHFRVVHLPRPGTERQMLDLAAQLYTEPLDRTRPLWRMVVIEGLASGQGATWTLIHHSIADGIGQLRMAELFQQLSRDEEPPPEVDLEGVVAQAVADHRAKEAGGDLATSLATTAAHSIGHLVRRGVGTARRAVGEVAMWPADPKRAVDRATDLTNMVGGAAHMAASSGAGVGAPLWRDRSRHRHLEYVAVPLDELKAASRAEGATINEAFLAVIADAAVRYHEERGATFETLNASFVVSTRRDGKAGGNAFTPVPVQLPAEKMPLRKRLVEQRNVIAAAREAATRTGGISSLAGVVNLLPTSVVTRTARAQAAKLDIATSNLRGYPVPVYIAGGEVLRNVTMGPLAGTPCNATALSYGNEFTVGLFIDPVAIDDPAGFRRCVADAFADLLSDGI
ncbi:MAG: DUF1298 domain-containing protein [Actinobacteria bacterium]|nr:DUF1298 domain-containing protein [Actinomycetota bacterium]NIS33731.1 DUF1298 domain-containing protein [Actinomycetota bacterium]NIT97054.1 DUF1298 domain-containing protein [Actinomycetota bacterium]NIU68576.1 DUF1298 domain-containing protein [Actinomycetota bacterium]NIV57239.1 DUF1298 domain-containing protein [Actinomycetota bacterium]